MWVVGGEKDAFHVQSSCSLIYLNLIIDIQRIKDGCKKFQCCGNELIVDVVPACIWIKVWGYATDTSIDMLENYFENKRRSNGGIVDNVRFLENEDAAVVTFRYESGML